MNLARVEAKMNSPGDFLARAGQVPVTRPRLGDIEVTSSFCNRGKLFLEA